MPYILEDWECEVFPDNSLVQLVWVGTHSPIFRLLVSKHHVVANECVAVCGVVTIQFVAFALRMCVGRGEKVDVTPNVATGLEV